MSFEESLECNVGSLTEEVLQKLLEIDEWYFSDSDSEESEATEESEAEEEAKSPKPQVFLMKKRSNLTLHVIYEKCIKTDLSTVQIRLLYMCTIIYIYI